MATLQSFQKRLLLAKKNRQRSVQRATNLETTRTSPTATAAAAATTTFIRNPDDVALNTKLHLTVHNLQEGDKPTNTQKAIDTKKEEFYQFCDAFYSHETNRYILSSEKMYRFMFFQSFREKKNKGGRAKVTDGRFFDIEAYNAVMRSYQTLQQEEGTDGSPPLVPTPTNPIGPSTFNTYRATLRSNYKEQIAHSFIGACHQWDHLWTQQFDELRKHVKGRVPKKRRETYQEKLSAKFAPFTMTERYPEIENALWAESYSTSRRSVCTGLRHRYCFLHTTSGILRCESLYRAELSDFLGIFIPKRDDDVHQPYIMVNQIPIGKTCHGRLQYGRATRHKDPLLCCVGALSIYLNYRFFMTREFDEFTVENWTDNQTWFDIKLLGDVCGSDIKKEMVHDGYSDKMKRILKRLGLAVNKLCHLGRHLGVRILELLEEESENKKEMGQWAQGVFEASYSTKLPLGPIRKLAGFTAKTSMYYNRRSQVEPPSSLLNSTPMGAWCYSAYQQVVEKAVDTGGHGTAVQVLKFFCEMNKIFLQDCAAMIAQRPDRAEHQLFTDIPCLHSEEFKSYARTMKETLSNDDSPLDARLRACVPVMEQWQRENHKVAQNIEGKVDDITSILDQIRNSIENGVDASRESEKRIAGLFMSMGAQLWQGEEPVLEDMEQIQMLPEPVCEQEQQQQRQTSPQQQNSPSLAIPNDSYRMVAKHNSLTEMWSEWYGIGNFHDEHGGIEGRNKKFGSKWRSKGTNVCKPSQYSIVQRIIHGVNRYMAANNMTAVAAIQDLEQVYRQCNYNNHKMVAYFQEQGLVGKKASRGRTQKAGDI